MFFFFLFGVGQRVKTLKAIPARLGSINANLYCVNCNKTAYPVAIRRDSWFELFFIPVFRIKKGQAILACDRCKGPLIEANACPTCGALVEQGDRYCHNCGAKT